MDKLKSIYIDSALSIIKGALCVVLQIPTSRTTESIKRKANNLGILTVKSIFSEPSQNDLNDIKQLIQNKIEENCPFQNYQLNRTLAEKLYGDTIYDNFGLAKEITEINLIILEEWNINCNRNRVLKSTGLIKGIEINKFKYLSTKEVLEVHFEVYPKYSFEELNKKYSSEKDLFQFLLAPLVKIQTGKESLLVNENDKRESVLEENGMGKDTNHVENEMIFLKEEHLPPKSKVVPPSGVETGIDQYQRSNVVTPWEVNVNEQEGINYNKLIKDFGCSEITEAHIKRIEQLTNRKAHHFLRRGIFFSHRDLDFLLNYYEQHKAFYIYTGRGPSSSSMHLGHLIPFYFCKYLQEAFEVPLVIQLSDDEKFLFNPNYTLQDIDHFAKENVKDIIAVGLDPELTFIFRNTEYCGNLYRTVLNIHKKITLNQSMNVFGFKTSDNVGKVSYPSFQIAPCFSECFPSFLKKNLPCLVPQGIDQDPFFRLSRDAAVKLALFKPVQIHSIFIPSLQGVKTKMSSTKKKNAVGSSDEPNSNETTPEKEPKNKPSTKTEQVNNSAILLTDTAEQIKNKINKFAFSGGGATIAEHKEKGANLEIDVSYQYLRYFLEDDEQLENIAQKYQKGEMLSGEIKKILIDCLTKIIQEHQKKRNALTPKDIDYFFSCEKPALQKFKHI